MHSKQHNWLLHHKAHMIMAGVIFAIMFCSIVYGEDKPDDWPCGIGSLSPCNTTENSSTIEVVVDEIPTEGVDNISISVEGDKVNSSNFEFTDVQEVEISDGDKPIVSFFHNFSNKSLNLSGMKIKKQSENYGYTIIKGLNISVTKTMYVPRVSMINRVCVKNAEIENIGEITVECNGSNETLFKPCQGQWINGIRCSLYGNYYKIENLSHSGGKEQPPETEKGYFTIVYLQEGLNHRDGYMHDGDMVQICFEGSEIIFEDQLLRLSLIPEKGYPTIAEFRTPAVMTVERVYLYP